MIKEDSKKKPATEKPTQKSRQKNKSRLLRLKYQYCRDIHKNRDILSLIQCAIMAAQETIFFRE